MVPFTHIVKKIKGAAHKSGDIDGTCKQALKLVLGDVISFYGITYDRKPPKNKVSKLANIKTQMNEKQQCLPAFCRATSNSVTLPYICLSWTENCLRFYKNKSSS